MHPLFMCRAMQAGIEMDSFKSLTETMLDQANEQQLRLEELSDNPTSSGKYY